MKSNVLLVGPFPPPRHGVSAVNEAVGKALLDFGCSVRLINTAPPSLDRRLWCRIQRIARIGHGLRAMLQELRRGSSRCYFSLSGGLGLLYESMLVFTASRAGARIVVHHHSFRYLDKAYWPMNLLVWSAGQQALHVVLGPAMQRALQRRYPILSKALVLSNAVFVGGPLAAAGDPTARPRTVGLLANLSPAKGLLDFIGLAEMSQAQGLPWRYVLAGPYENPVDMERMKPRMRALSNLEYRGPLYAEAKEDFFRSIDIFVFPTRYIHEAEPLVVLEALRHCCPVIAYGRGCIADMISDGGGLAIPTTADFLRPALEQLEEWRNDGVNFHKHRQAACARYAEMHAQASLTMGRFLSQLAG